MASVSSGDLETPQATLRAPSDAGLMSAIDAAKAKEADKKILLNLLQAPELFLLADANSSEAANRGIPISLLHAILRVFLSNFGLNWEKFLVGGILGKTISDAIKLRQKGGEAPVEKGPLATTDGNVVPGQNRAPKKGKKKSRYDDLDGDKKAPRDSVFNAHHQKYRAGIILNHKNVIGQGNVARFVLPFVSPSDSCASLHLKAVCEALGITNLAELSFNIEEKTREPEANPIVANQSSPASNSLVLSSEGQLPNVGEYVADDMLEFYVQPPHGSKVSSSIQRESQGPDCVKSLIITGSLEGAVCDELVPRGDEMVHICRQYTDLQRSTFPATPWKLSIPLSPDLDLTCRGTKRLASGVHVFTIKKKKEEPAVTSIEEF